MVQEDKAKDAEKQQYLSKSNAKPIYRTHLSALAALQGGES